MERKAFFTDLDGTLLNSSGTISSGNREAINELCKAGHHIVIATGRPLVSALAQAEALGLAEPGSILIAFNGGVIYDFRKHEVIHRSVIQLPLVFEIYEEVNRRKLHIQTYSETKVLIEPRCSIELTGHYCRRLGMEYEIIPDIHMLKREPEKILLIDPNTREYLDQLIEEIAPLYSGKLDFFYSSKDLLEIVPTGVNKGNGIRLAAQYLGIRPENTIAAGDEANDIPMLQAAHYGVAMKNSSKAVLSVIPLVSENDNDHDGVAEIIRKYLL